MALPPRLGDHCKSGPCAGCVAISSERPINPRRHVPRGQSRDDKAMPRHDRLRRLIYSWARRGDVCRLRSAAGHEPCFWENYRSAVFYGAMDGRQMAVIRFMEAHGQGLHSADEGLSSAAFHDWPELAALMLDRGANMDQRSYSGKTPLMVAADLGSQRMVRLLLSRGADASACDHGGCTALHYAAEVSCADVVQILLSHGVDANQADTEFGHTPLHVVDSHVGLGRYSPIQCRRTARLLLRYGADMESADKSQCTPLLHAACGDRPVFLEELLKAGAHIEARSDVGRTALFVAAIFKRMDNVRRLIAAGADVNSRDQWGMTPLFFASAPIARLLIEAGASVNCRDETGSTPLHAAAEVGELETATVLVSAGADTSAKDAKAQTPSDLALEEGYYQLAKLLGG